MDTKREPGDSTVASYVNQPAARALAAIALLALGGCTTTTRLAPIDQQSTVAFVVVSSPPTQGPATVHDTAVHRSYSSGVNIGAATGALAGLACGPLAVLCVPAGLLEGMVAGGLTGAVVGLSNKLPKDKVAQLNDRLQRLQQSLDPVTELRRDVLDTAHKHWELTDDTSAGVVTLEVQSLTLTSASRDKIALVMRVSVRTAPGMSADTSRQVTQKSFEFVSPKYTLAAWLDEHGEVPEDSLRSACRQIATQVVAELTPG